MKRLLVVVSVFVAVIAANVAPVSAAPGSVVINEIMYKPVSGLDEQEYLELHNPGDTAVSLNGMSFTSGIFGTFGDVTLPPGGFMVVSPSAAATQSFYSVAVVLEYTDLLSNGGETVTLTAADGVTVVDTVSYDDLPPWPIEPDGAGPSLELTDPLLGNDDAVSWAASISPTPGAENSTLGQIDPIQFGEVTVTPAWPTALETVTISLDITGVSAASLVYRVMFGPEITVPMTNVGETFSVSLPAQSAGDLVRYRIVVASKTLPVEGDSIDYLGYVVKKSLTTDLPVFEWFISDPDYDALYASRFPIEAEKPWFPSIFAYEGTVYTGASVKLRGLTSLWAYPKQGISVDMPAGHDFVAPGLFEYPVDEFALKSDFNSAGRSYARAPIAWFLMEEAGFTGISTFQTRVQKNGDFYAQYRVKEKLDGTWRDAAGINGGHFFKAIEPGIDDWERKGAGGTDTSAAIAFYDFMQSSPSQAAVWDAVDVPNMVNYWAASAIIRHPDQAIHNLYMHWDEDGTGLWRLYPWDLDHTLGSNPGIGDCALSTMIDMTCLHSPVFDALHQFPDFRDMYYRRIRTLTDGPMQSPEIAAIYDAMTQSLAAGNDLEIAAWGAEYDPLASNANDANLLSEIAQRITAANADNRVPSSQAAATGVLITEIQHSPVAGQPEFLELYNPSSEWVDLSLWQIPGLGLTIPGGTVVAPQSHIVFTSSTPLFRAVHDPGADYLVVDYPAGISGVGELIELIDTAGVVRDSVSYQIVAPWPVLPANGLYSLELADYGFDNSLAGSWHSSAVAGGTPGSLNSAGQVEPGDSTPPVVSFPVPSVFVDSGSPQTVSGGVSDVGSGVDRVEIVAIDLGAAGATGVTGLRAWSLLGAWSLVPEAPVLTADVVGDVWSFTWDPVPGGSGSYVIGIRAFDVEGNKWPVGKDWQALIVLSDTSAPSVTVDTPIVVGDTISWSGTGSDDVAVRKVRMIIRHVETNEYWNGTSWITSAAAATDPNVLLHADLASPLSPSTGWSYSLSTTRTGTFQTLHWSQNGAYTYTPPTETNITK